MDFPVVWSPSATRDLDAIAEYIANDSRIYASSFVTRILRIAGQLRYFPDSGRVVPEFNDPAVRERFVFQYRLIYQRRSHDILILALIHGVRILPEDVNLDSGDH